MSEVGHNLPLLVYDGEIAVLEVVGGLAADGDDLDSFPAVRRTKVLFDLAEEIGIERPTQSLVRGDDDHPGPLPFSALQEGVGIICTSRNPCQDPRQSVRVGSRLGDRHLGPPKLRRRDHFHGLGDLLGSLD